MNMPPPTVIMTVLRIHNYGSPKKKSNPHLWYILMVLKFLKKKTQLKSPSCFVINFMYELDMH